MAEKVSFAPINGKLVDSSTFTCNGSSSVSSGILPVVALDFRDGTGGGMDELEDNSEVAVSWEAVEMVRLAGCVGVVGGV